MKKRKRDYSPIPLLYINDIDDFLQELKELPVSHAIDALRYARGVSPCSNHLLCSAKKWVSLG